MKNNLENVKNNEQHTTGVQDEDTGVRVPCAQWGDFRVGGGSVF
jgi:hypothetical protein